MDMMVRVHKVDRTALLTGYRSRQSERFEGLRASRILVRDPSLSKVTDAKEQDAKTCFSARASIARAVDSVLLNARRKTADWLASSPSVGSLCFADLGGTSLMAVEAAWLASRYLVGDEVTSASTFASSRLLLEAADFFGGTLDDAASTLANNHARAASTPTAVGARRAEARPLVTPTQLPVMSQNLPAAPSPLVSHSENEASMQLMPRGVKRHLEGPETAVAEGAQVRDIPPILALGRSGAGVLHSSQCLGSMTAPLIIHDAAVVAHVEFRVRWSACLTKCIDATPLVVVPCHSSLCVKNTAGRTHKAAADLTYRRCFCSLGRIPAAKGADGSSGQGSHGTTGKVISVSTRGTVYIGSHSGEFKALSLDTGVNEWSLTLGGRIESGAACSSDGSTVFVGCHDRYLRAINRKTGTVCWSHETGDTIKCTPISVSAKEQRDASSGGAEMTGADSVLVGSHDGLLLCLLQADGHLLWSFDCGGALFASPAHDANTCVVYAATTKGRLIAIARSLASTSREEITDADLLHCAAEHGAGGAVAGLPFAFWDHQLPAPCFSTPAVCFATGALVLGCVDGGLYCFSAKGDRLWVCADGQKPVFSSPCLLPTLPSRSEDTEGGADLVWGCHGG